MDLFVQCGEWLANAFVALWSAIGTWGIMGVGIVGIAVIRVVSNLFKKVFS